MDTPEIIHLKNGVRVLAMGDTPAIGQVVEIHHAEGTVKIRVVAPMILQGQLMVVPKDKIEIFSEGR